MRIAIIDADIPTFKSSASAESKIDWGDGVVSHEADEDEARKIFTATIERIQYRLEAHKVVLAFSDSVNWRKSVLPSYKSNRADKAQPLLRKTITEWAKKRYTSITKPGLEGDDVLGILLTRPQKPGEELIACTIDKDLKCIPGTHYNFDKDELFEVTTEEADRWHLFQTLMGDTTDGYTGCPGTGPETANKFLDEPYFWMPYEYTFKRGIRKGLSETRYDQQELGDRSLWDGIVSIYAKAGYDEAYALAQARVARICRASDYDFEKKEVKLWTP